LKQIDLDLPQRMQLRKQLALSALAELQACDHLQTLPASKVQGKVGPLTDTLVRQHGMAYGVANGEEVGNVAAHLDVDENESPVGHNHAGLVGGDLVAVGRAAD
jgi:hypothetical protein